MKRTLVIAVLAACGGESAQDFCVGEANKYREMEGVEPIEHSSELEAFAEEGAEVDFASAPHMHFGNDGGGIALAENECPQQLGWTRVEGESEKTVIAQCIRAFYEEGPGGGHYENLIGPYAKLGCGTFESDGKITIVLDFGN
jgi:cysteine-rich secretory family protein